MRYLLGVCGLVIVVALGALPAGVAEAAGTVTGSVTTNGQKIPLVLAYVDESAEDIIIVLASKEVPRDAIPFIGEELARKLKIHAVVFTVARAKRALGRTFSGVFYPGPEMGFVGMAEGVATLQLKRLDATGIEGRIFTPKSVELSTVTYAFDVAFSVPLGKVAPPPPAVVVKVSGDASPPASAYAEYYRAVFAGDVKAISGFFAAARRKDFEAADPKKREMLLELMKTNPAEIRILQPVIAGATATLTVEGVNETSGKTTGTITMVREGGAWKIAGEKWSTK